LYQAAALAAALDEPTVVPDSGADGQIRD
jgi:hypothetical protein